MASILASLPHSCLIGPGDEVTWDCRNFDENIQPLRNIFHNYGINLYNPIPTYSSLPKARRSTKSKVEWTDEWHVQCTEESKTKLLHLIAQVLHLQFFFDYAVPRYDIPAYSMKIHDGKSRWHPTMCLSADNYSLEQMNSKDGSA